MLIINKIGQYITNTIKSDGKRSIKYDVLHSIYEHGKGIIDNRDRWSSSIKI